MMEKELESTYRHLERKSAEVHLYMLYMSFCFTFITTLARVLQVCDYFYSCIRLRDWKKKMNI